MMKVVYSLAVIFCVFTIKAQDHIKNDFRLPLDGIARFSGNYGELRPNHFHAGLDFRTHPSTHLPIYAIADGYVSRIKVGTHGYGKVLYVTHANGYVSVYGHQHHFSNKIAEYTYSEQKKQETFEIELFPDSSVLAVKKGEVIGYTGNTGNSSGPHLHFEIREEKTEIPLNPQLFFSHEDNFAPVCSKMVIYSVPEQGKPTVYKSVNLTANTKGKEITLTEKIQMPLNAGLAFSCFDKENIDAGKNQVYGIRIKVDGEQVYMHKMNGISFEDARYVNWFQETSAGLKSEKLQKCFRTGNNELPIFVDLKNEGLLNYNNGQLKPGDHNVVVEFFDVNGNTTTLKFSYLMNEGTGVPKYDCNFNCLKENLITLNGAQVKFPEKCLFYNTNTDVRVLKSNPPNYLSSIYKIFNDDVPVLKAYEVSVELNKQIPKELEEKVCLLTMKNNMTGISYAGGKFVNGKLTGTVKSCGLVTVGFDTIAPAIKTQARKTNIAPAVLKYTVTDNLSAIGKFRLEINGEWVLAEYEHKTHTIFYVFNDKSPSGELKIQLKVWDKQMNLSTHTQTLKR